MNETEDLVKKSKILLFKTVNCCESQIVPIQVLYHVTDTNLRKSVTGLAGGINNSGSTCGAVFGGALNLAIMHRTSSQSWDISSEINLIHAVQKFVNSFEQEFGSFLCRERTSLDLKKLSGSSCRRAISGSGHRLCLRNGPAFAGKRRQSHDPDAQNPKVSGKTS